MLGRTCKQMRGLSSLWPWGAWWFTWAHLRIPWNFWTLKWALSNQASSDSCYRQSGSFWLLSSTSSSIPQRARVMTANHCGRSGSVGRWFGCLQFSAGPRTSSFREWLRFCCWFLGWLSLRDPFRWTWLSLRRFLRFLYLHWRGFKSRWIKWGCWRFGKPFRWPWNWSQPIFPPAS